MDDLSILYPIDEGSFIIRDKDGNEHIKNMFIPSITSMISGNQEEGETDLDHQHRVISSFLKAQYDFMNSEWVSENLSIFQQNDIYDRINKKALADQERFAKLAEKRMPKRTLMKKLK